MPASTADTVNASVRIASGLTPIEPAAVSESRTARIASPQPLCASRLYSASTIAISRIADDRDAALADRPAGDRRIRNVHQAVLAAGHAFPFDRGELDDEAESDRDHRQIRAADPQGDEPEQRADRPRSSTAATGSVHQKLQPSLVVSTAVA